MSKKIDFKLYLITDKKLFTNDYSLFTAVEDALKAGVKAVQLREKDLPIRELLDMAYRMREITSRYNAKLFVNDRVDVALCVNADGVHLGQSGIPVHAVRKITAEKLLIGASTHNAEEALAAQEEGADFITFGPVYATPSKAEYGKPAGIESLKSAIGKTSIPVFGIGGIKTDTVKEVIHSGAYGIALIRGILGEIDIKGAAAKYLEILQK